MYVNYVQQLIYCIVWLLFDGHGLKIRRHVVQFGGCDLSTN